MRQVITAAQLPARDIFFLNFGVRYSRARYFSMHSPDLKGFPIHLLRNSDITVANVLRMQIAICRQARQLAWVSLHTASVAHAPPHISCCNCSLFLSRPSDRLKSARWTRR